MAHYSSLNNKLLSLQKNNTCVIQNSKLKKKKMKQKTNLMLIIKHNLTTQHKSKIYQYSKQNYLFPQDDTPPTEQEQRRKEGYLRSLLRATTRTAINMETLMPGLRSSTQACMEACCLMVAMGSGQCSVSEMYAW